MARVRESLQAAFTAVSDSDILESDFSSLEQALTSRLNSIEVTSQNGAESIGLTPDADTENDREPNFRSEGPPQLMKGDDDIFWMSQLHGGLLKASALPVPSYEKAQAL